MVAEGRCGVSGYVYPVGEWFRARARRAAAGKAPRLAIRRCICIALRSDARWAVCIAEMRFGKWMVPQQLTGEIALDAAREAAVRAWRKYRIPVFYAEGDRLRPIRIDRAQTVGGPRHAS